MNPGLPPLATQLGNVQVLVNGSPAPLYFVSRQQINFQMPYETPVAHIATVQVVNAGAAGNIRSVQAVASSPHILVWAASQAPGGYGIVVNPDNTLSLPATDTGLGRAVRPSRPGDVHHHLLHRTGTDHACRPGRPGREFEPAHEHRSGHRDFWIGRSCSNSAVKFRRPDPSAGRVVSGECDDSCERAHRRKRTSVDRFGYRHQQFGEHPDLNELS